MSGVVWSPYIWPGPRPLDMARLRAAEAKAGVRFPQDYVECLRAHQGMTPDPCEFPFGDGFTTVFNVLLHFDADTATDRIVELQDILRDSDAPGGLHVFATDPAGNLICFDFRDRPDAPVVVILDHEGDAKEPLPVAATFTDFLALLR
jgi:cell wall assembly regulator SMI1